MIIETHSDAEFDSVMRLMTVINEMRRRPTHYCAPVIEGTPGIVTRWANEAFL